MLIIKNHKLVCEAANYGKSLTCCDHEHISNSKEIKIWGYFKNKNLKFWGISEIKILKTYKQVHDFIEND